MAEDKPVEAPEEGEIPDLSKMHPLENRWTLWFDNPSRTSKQSSATWGQSLRAVYTFDTVEDFWWCVTHPRPPPLDL
jgi:translation initiation factor 4E